MLIFLFYGVVDSMGEDGEASKEISALLNPDDSANAGRVNENSVSVEGRAVNRETTPSPSPSEDHVPEPRKVSFAIGHTDNDNRDFTQPPEAPQPERRRSENFDSYLSIFGN